MIYYIHVAEIDGDNSSNVIASAAPRGWRFFAV